MSALHSLRSDKSILALAIAITSIIFVALLTAHTYQLHINYAAFKAENEPLSKTCSKLNETLTKVLETANSYSTFTTSLPRVLSDKEVEALYPTISALGLSADLWSSVKSIYDYVTATIKYADDVALPRFWTAMTINVDSKPYLEHNVYEKWVPERLECLFIAESPPGDSERFFYKDDKDKPELKSQLRENLFDLLGIKRGLLEFKEKGFLLVDAVECRVKKRDGGKVKVNRSILKKAARNCSFILKLKLELARLGTAKLVVMGETALEALKVLGFSELKGLRVMRNFGEVVDSRGFKVFLLFLPFTRNLAKAKRRLKEEGLKELREKLLRFCASSTSP